MNLQMTFNVSFVESDKAFSILNGHQETGFDNYVRISGCIQQLCQYYLQEVLSDVKC